ncbi:hypothetical protein CVS40_3829 [Lucilia cuprina]|nr:hypothetical protein CVS40_3829 [Lucilia cuprina]
MENHRLQVVNKVTQNPYLLAYIFKFTSCQTQLKLIKISGYFQYVIQYHIWKVKYQNLKIEEDKPSYTIASVKPEEILRQIHFQEFLYLSVDIIKQLSISSYSYQQRSIIFQLERVFPNLIALRLESFLFKGNEDYKYLRKIFPNLKKLYIKNCFADNSLTHPIISKDNLPREIFVQWPYLEELRIKHFKKYSIDGKMCPQHVYVKNDLDKK